MYNILGKAPWESRSRKLLFDGFYVRKKNSAFVTLRQAFIGWTLNDHQIPEKHILRHTFQLVIYDKELDQLKFPHLSVREYLECKEQYTADRNQAIIGLGCIRSLALLVDKAYLNLVGCGDLIGYAATYWSTHCQLAGSYRQEGELAAEMKAFLSAVPSPRFKAWSESLPEHEMDSPMGLGYAKCIPCHPAFVICLFGFSECLDEMIRSHSLPTDSRTHGNGFLYLPWLCTCVTLTWCRN